MKFTAKNQTHWAAIGSKNSKERLGKKNKKKNSHEYQCKLSKGMGFRATKKRK